MRYLLVEGGNLKRGRPGGVEVSGRAFRILLLVSRGINSPIDIAKQMNICPSSVVFHLKRLRKAGYVRYGEKEGKKEHYEINWDGLVGLFLEEAYPSYMFRDDERIQKTLERENMPDFNKLLKNKYVIELVKEAFKNLSRRPFPEKSEMTLRDFMMEFGEALKNLTLTLADKDDEDFRDFKTLVEAVKREIFTFKHPGSFEWAEALAKLGYVEKFI
jgi:DNA-binding CsgD family transcriptional regulator